MIEEGRIQRLVPKDPVFERRSVKAFRRWDGLEFERHLDLAACWWAIRKRRWLILTAFFAVLTPVTIWVYWQKPVYRAETLLEIQKESRDILTAQDLFAPDAVSDVYLETQYKILESDTLLQNVIDQLGLDHVQEFVPSSRWSWWKKKTGGKGLPAAPGGLTERDPAANQGTLALVRDRLEVLPIRRSRLVKISFDSRDPELAARVVNTLASDYIKQDSEARLEASQKASESLSRQLAGVGAKLQESETALQTFARTNNLIFLGTGRGNKENLLDERIRQLQEELTKAQAARIEKESLYKLVLTGDYASLPGAFESKPIQDLTVQLADLERQSAQLSTTLTVRHPKAEQVQNQIKAIEAALTRERKRVAEQITNQYVAAVNWEKLAGRELEQQQQRAHAVAERLAEYDRFQRDVDTNQNLYESLLQHLKEAGFSAELKVSEIRVIDLAKAPQAPVGPRVALNLALAATLGLLLGVGLAFLTESMDKTFKSPGEMEAFLGSTLLASVPWTKSLKGRNPPVALFSRSLHRSGLEISTQPAVCEAFRCLGASVLLFAASHPLSSIVIASAQPGEGKTTVAINLSRVLAELGRRVLLIDLDLRNPSIQSVFGIGRESIVRYLSGEQNWRSMVQPTASQGLDVLLCGPPPPNPVKLITSGLMRKLLTEASREYVFVVMDSSPLLRVPEGRILASVADGVILVNSSNTPRDVVQRAMTAISGVGATVVGVVLNKFSSKNDQYYGAYV